MASEFVTILHTGHGPAHYDLMIARGQSLATWQSPADPADLAPGQSVAVRPLPDHRTAYLTYEGPVAGGRGEVRRVHRGRAETIGDDPTRWRLLLDDETCRARFELSRSGSDDSPRWTLTRIE